MKFWRAVFEKSVLTIFVLLWPLAIHFSTKLLPSLQVSISGNRTKSGRHDGGLMPCHRLFDLLLCFQVITNSDEPIMKNLTSKYSCHICGLQQKLWSLLLKYYIHSLRNHVIRAARWRTSISGMEKLFSIVWENRMKFWRAVFEKSVLTLFVLLWPLAIHFSAKLV